MAPVPQDRIRAAFDSGLVYERPMGEHGFAQLRASGVRQDHDHVFGELLEKDRRETRSRNLDFRRALGPRGSAASPSRWTNMPRNPFPISITATRRRQFSPRWTVLHPEPDRRRQRPLGQPQRIRRPLQPATFVAVSARRLVDPRVLGEGFYAPTPFIEETEATGLSRLEPLSGLGEKVAQTVSLDFSYAAGALEAGLTLFGSDIDDAVRLEPVAADRVRLVNADGATRARGVELLMRWREAPFSVTGSYLFIDGGEPDETGTGRRNVRSRRDVGRRRRGLGRA